MFIYSEVTELQLPADRTVFLALKTPVSTGDAAQHSQQIPQAAFFFLPPTKSKLSVNCLRFDPSSARAALNCFTRLVNNVGVEVLRALMVCCRWIQNKCDQPVIVAVSFHILESVVLFTLASFLSFVFCFGRCWDTESMQMHLCAWVNFIFTKSVIWYGYLKVQVFFSVDSGTEFIRSLQCDSHIGKNTVFGVLLGSQLLGLAQNCSEWKSVELCVDGCRRLVRRRYAWP